MQYNFQHFLENCNQRKEAFSSKIHLKSENLIMDNYSLIDDVASNISSNHTTIKIVIFPRLFVLSKELKISYMTMGVIGILLNLFSMSVIFFYKPMRNCSSKAYLFGLCATGFFTSIIIVLSVIFEDQGGFYDGNDPWDIFLCKLWYSRGILWSTMTVSVFMILALALDQFVAVIWPIFYKMKFSKERIVPALLISSISFF